MCMGKWWGIFFHDPATCASVQWTIALPKPMRDLFHEHGLSNTVGRR